MITSKCYSDDHQVEVEFDATDWFKQASTKEILDLSICDWGGDYASDDVALFYSTTTTAPVFEHNNQKITRDRKDQIGFENRVNEEQALAWLTENRPDAINAINKYYDDMANKAIRMG